MLAVVPARGGSKGVPLKNIQPLAGIPLIAHVGNIVREVGVFDRAVVSTDHSAIVDAAVAAGLDAPFLRPVELSGDVVSDDAVLIHALGEMERIDNVRYDVIVMLQPTSPLRRASDVLGAISMLIDGGWDAVWTVSRTDLKYHPLKQLVVTEGRLKLSDSRGSGIVARQQLTPVFHRNGAAYVFTRECIVEQRTILGAKTGAFTIDRPMVSIDTLSDFEYVEAILAGDGSRK